MIVSKCPSLFAVICTLTETKTETQSTNLKAKRDKMASVSLENANKEITQIKHIHLQDIC